MNMRRITQVTVLVVLVLFGAGGDNHAESESLSDTHPLKPLENWVGGTWTDGREFVEYEWGVNRQIIKSKAHVMDRGKVRWIYESVYGWNPDTGKIVFRTYTESGTLHEGVVVSGENRLTKEWTSFSRQEKSHFRQEIRLDQADRFSWKVIRLDGGEEQVLHESTFERKQGDTRRDGPDS